MNWITSQTPEAIKTENILTMGFCNTFGIKMIVDPRKNPGDGTNRDGRYAYLEYNPHRCLRKSNEYRY